MDAAAYQEVQFMARYDLQSRQAQYFRLSSQIAHMDNAQLFLDFFVSMRRNQKKDTKFPHAKLARLLKEAGFLSGSI